MRARNIKPGFFDNEVLAMGGPCAQILFEGLWCLADREGRLEDRPLRIKAKIFPYYEPVIGLTVNPPLSNGESTVIERLIQFLSDKGFVSRYKIGETRYIQITNFTKHQSPHKTEKGSVIPAIPDGYKNNGEPTVNPPLDNGGSRPDSLIHGFTDSLIPDLKISASADAGPSSPTEFYLTKKKKKLTGKRLETFERFWIAFDHKRGKAEAADAWIEIPKLTDALVETIIKAAMLEATNRPELIKNNMTPKWAEGWIRGKRWEDEDLGSDTGKAKRIESMELAELILRKEGDLKFAAFCDQENLNPDEVQRWISSNSIH
jgi:hypothetical protein